MFDITKPVDLTLHAEGTGPKRLRRPVYTDFMPPCNSACPAGENIQAWMAHAQSGNYFEAFQTIVEDNPFPALMGRVCVKPCETGCNRTHIDTAVSIHAVERYIGDEALKQKWPIKFHADTYRKKSDGSWSRAWQVYLQRIISPGWDIPSKCLKQAETAGGLLVFRGS